MIQRIVGDLEPGASLALLGLKHPERWPDWLIDLGIWLNRPFGVSREYARFRPLVSLQHHMKTIAYQERYFEAAYHCIGEAV